MNIKMTTNIYVNNKSDKALANSIFFWRDLIPICTTGII
jgi:hypothetical protein